MLQSVSPQEEANQIRQDLVETQPRRSRWHRPLLVFKAVLQAVIALVVLFAAFKGMTTLVATKPEVPKRPAQEKSYPVTTFEVARGDFSPSITVFGETVAGREVDLRVLAGGEVVATHPNLKAGGYVDEGDVLIEIDQFDYQGAITEARANLAEAEAALVESEGRVSLEKGNLVRAAEQLEFAQKDLTRAEELIGRGAVTEQTVDSRKLLVSQRQQNLEQTENSLKLEEAKVTQQKYTIERLEWRLQDAERQLENTTLRAPFDAVVRSESAEIGRLVNVSDAIISLYSRDQIEVRFTLSDNQYGRLLAEDGAGVIGRPVTVTWVLGNQPVEYTGEVSRIGADVASTRGGVDLFAKIDMSSTVVPLRPGAFVEVTLADRTYSDSFRVPETAFYGDGTVFVIKESRLEARQVEGLAIDDGFILVTGELDDGDMILETRIPQAGDGLLVEDVNAPPEPAASERPVASGS